MFKYKIKGEIGVDVTLDKIKRVFSSISPKEEVLLYIDSEGGDIDEAFEIYNYLLKYPKIKTYVEGVCYSAATIISLLPKSIKNRLIENRSSYLIHLPYLSNRDLCNLDVCNADFLQYAADYVKERQNRLIDFYCEKLNYEPDYIKNVLSKNKVITSVDAEAFGLVKRIDKKIFQNEQNVVYNYIEQFNKSNLKMFEKIKAFFGFRVKNELITSINGEEVTIENTSPDSIEGSKIYYTADQRAVENGTHTLEAGLEIEVSEGMISKATFSEVTPVEEVIEPVEIVIPVENGYSEQEVKNEVEINIEEEPIEESPIQEEVQTIIEEPKLAITAEDIVNIMKDNSEIKAQVENKILSEITKGDESKDKLPIINHNKNNKMTNFSINQERLLEYAEAFFATKNLKKADGTFYVKNANALTNGLSYTFNGIEDIEQLVYAPTIKTDAISDHFTINYRVTAGQQLFLANALSDVVRKGSATCVVTESTSSSAITSRKLDTFLLQVDHEECGQVFQNTIFAQYQGNPDSFNLEGTKLEEILLNILRDALRRDLAKLLAFGDSASVDASFNAMDGKWTKLIAGVTAGDVVRVDTITALSVSNPTANAEYYLRRMYDGQSDEFASIDDSEKMFEVTRNVYQNYLNMLETRVATEAAMSLTIDGKKELTFRGIPVKPIYEWSKNIAASPIAPLDTLMLLTTKDNHVVGFDGNSEGLEVDFFYDRVTRKNKMRASLKVGYNYVTGIKNIVSYGNI